jgi:hypothetical protein
VSAPDQAAEEPPARPRRLSFGIVGQISTVVGLITAIVSLYLLLRPKPSPKPVVDIEVQHVDGRATLRKYLNESDLPAGDLAPAVLGRVGVLGTFAYDATGLDGKEVTVVVKLLGGTSGETACRHAFGVTIGRDPAQILRVWTPFPTHPRPEDETFELHLNVLPPGGGSSSIGSADPDPVPALGRAQPGPPNSALASLCDAER